MPRKSVESEPVDSDATTRGRWLLIYMQRFLLASLAVLSLASGCGDTDKVGSLPDAPIAPDASMIDVPAGPATVISTDFEGALPPSIDVGDCAGTPSQGYAPLGLAGNQFGATFLRCQTGNAIVINVTNLPTHTKLSLGFLFAAIDSLDGTGSFPAGDFVKITLDGTEIFRESFANAELTQIQSYIAPPGGELARHVDLGFSGPGGNYTDSAYDMNVDGRFQNLPHTGSTATIMFTLEGAGVQSLDDESWAIDNLRITATP